MVNQHVFDVPLKPPNVQTPLFDGVVRARKGGGKERAPGIPLQTPWKGLDISGGHDDEIERLHRPDRVNARALL